GGFAVINWVEWRGNKEGSSLSGHRLAQFPGRNNRNPQPVLNPSIRRAVQWADDPVSPLRVLLAKRRQTARLKRIRFPFALDGVGGITAARHNEVHFPLLFVEKLLSGSRNRSATLGRSQLRNSASGRLRARTVLPT